MKRQNYHIYLVAFTDDHSSFIVSYGLHTSPSSTVTLEGINAPWR